MIDTGTKTTNLVAAVPSLHAGYATLVAITLWQTVPRSWRPLLVLYPVMMGLMLVATGEHYVVDILLGVGYAFAAHLMWNHIERWWHHRKGVSREAEPLGSAHRRRPTDGADTLSLVDRASRIDQQSGGSARRLCPPNPPPIFVFSQGVNPSYGVLQRA
jgi:hypothetical protein